MLKKEFINPHPMGFTNTVTCSNNGTKTIYISGQVGYADGRVGDTFEEQASMVYNNLIKELESAGANVDDVVKLNAYVVDLDRDKSKAMRKAKDKYFTQENQPASTMVGVSALVMKELLVEVEATAVVDEK
ncbi:MAG: RidA family protein [Gammaproteobacteria bacterium]|nr:RidA family protein [Gammaproteobacteria bacterium]